MHTIFVDLGYGDSGKGVTVARACVKDPTATVVKFTGGAQAAHNVVWNGNHHTFSQFGSGTMIGNPTFLTKNFLVDVPAIFRENNHLFDTGIPDALDNLYISSECLVITKAMVAANHHLEDTRHTRHGSTGRGIGTTVEYHQQTGTGVFMGDLEDPMTLFEKMTAQRTWLRETFGIELRVSVFEEIKEMWQAPLLIKPEAYWADYLGGTSSSFIFEGSQGVLLDENIGFFPHVTRATTTSRNAERLLESMGVENNDYEIVGIIRTYMTRHGAGPFATEFVMPVNDNDHNGVGRYQGEFRRGYLDVSAINYALQYQEIDKMVITHTDITLPMAYSDSLPDFAYRSLRDRAANTENMFNRPYELGQPAAWYNILGEFKVPLYHLGFGPDVRDYVDMRLGM
jgi:adenylosuccinate synthase